MKELTPAEKLEIVGHVGKSAGLFRENVDDFRHLLSDDASTPRYFAVYDGRIENGHKRSHGHIHLSEEVRQKMVESQMLYTEPPEVFMEVVDWAGDYAGWSLVILKYNSIIGSRWLAMVKSETVPYAQA